MSGAISPGINHGGIMDTIRMAAMLRYLFSPEDSTLTRPETANFADGFLPVAKTLLWFILSILASLALTQLT